MSELIRIKITELEKRLCRSRQSIWRDYTKGDFPKPHYLGRDRVWYLSEIEAWEDANVSKASPYKVSMP